MVERTYGRTATGRVITEAMLVELATEAVAGCDVAELLARRSRRPPMHVNLAETPARPRGPLAAREAKRAEDG